MNFTKEQIRDAARLLVEHYGQAIQNGRLEFYGGSVERLMQVVAEDAVAQAYLSPDLAEVAVPEAVEFVRRGGRWITSPASSTREN